MASLRDIRNRIASVKNTQQVTRAMKMVAAAKLRRAQENIFNALPYANKIGEIIGKTQECIKMVDFYLPQYQDYLKINGIYF